MTTQPPVTEDEIEAALRYFDSRGRSSYDPFQKEIMERAARIIRHLRSLNESLMANYESLSALAAAQTDLEPEFVVVLNENRADLYLDSAPLPKTEKPQK